MKRSAAVRLSITRPVFRAAWVHTLLCTLVLAGQPAQAATPTEMPGAKDHALVSRYAGAVLQSTADERFESLRIPVAAQGKSTAVDSDKSPRAEGHVSSYFYVGPAGRTALEVFRNYQAALTQAGFTTLFSCELRACDSNRITGTLVNEVVRPRKWPADRAGAASAVERDVRFISARLTRDGAESHVLLFVGEPNSIWQQPTAVLLVVESAPLETGNVVVSTERLQKSLAAEGRIALYGIYFDTGRAELKPGSSAQIEEMARLLQADKGLRVAIVGHTDNVGTPQANLELSRRRAEAVVAALVSGQRIEASRLSAQGLASYAPVASNRSEAGRAKNRRVEMVEQ